MHGCAANDKEESFMYNIEIKDTNGSVLESIDTESAMIISNGNAGMANCERSYMRTLRLDDNNVIKPYYLDIVEKLCSKYSRYLTVNWPGNICCMVDEEWEPSEKANKNTLWKIDIKRSSKDLRLLTGYEYVIKMRQHWIDLWSEEQLIAAIMSQLLRINPQDGSILKYSEDFNSKLIATFGQDYLSTKTHVDIPNLLENDVVLHEFKRADGQISMDEIDDEESDEDRDDEVGDRDDN